MEFYLFIFENNVSTPLKTKRARQEITVEEQIGTST